VRSETFNGGTRITSALIDSANYMLRHARPDARRAIVILTDDETQDAEDESRVEGALARANAVMSFLQAPYEVPTARGPGRGRRGGGLGWPGGGGGIGFPGGGWPGGGGIPGGGGGGGGPVDRSHSAGCETIAHDSGGDTMSVDDASALEDTLARLRQRYALHFYLTDEAQAKSQHSVRVDLSQEARMRYPDAEVRSRRVFMSGSDANPTSGPTVVTHQTAPADPAPTYDNGSQSQPSPKRRVAVNEDSSGPVINTVETPDAQTPDAPPPPQPQPQNTPAPQPKGWPRATPNTTNPNQQP
jgi:hypothetical protein